MSKEVNSKEKDFWDILQSLGPMVIAVSVAVIGGWYNLREGRIQRSYQKQQAYTTVLAQRESSDNEIRANMFNTLFEALFHESLIKDQGRSSKLLEATMDVPPGVGEPFSDEVNGFKQQITFLDVLSRNFETIDIKPLFEDLDEQLSKKIDDTSNSHRESYYEMRETVRKIGHNLAVKQLNALASIEGSIVNRFSILEDRKGQITVKQSKEDFGNLSTSPTSEDKLIPLEIRADEIHNGSVRITMIIQGTRLGPVEFEAPRFNVNFYDLPYIDNSRLSSDVRVAAVLGKYISVDDIDKFGEVIDEELKPDYESYKEKGISEFADLYIIQFPTEYTGLRDRPYIERVLQNALK